MLAPLRPIIHGQNYHSLDALVLQALSSYQEFLQGCAGYSHLVALLCNVQISHNDVWE